MLEKIPVNTDGFSEIIRQAGGRCQADAFRNVQPEFEVDAGHVTPLVLGEVSELLCVCWDTSLKCKSGLFGAFFILACVCINLLFTVLKFQ